jgi:hypothetical protein
MALDQTERLNLAIAGGAIATSAALAPPLFTGSVALGAVLEVVNYRALRRSTEAFFTGQLQGAGPWTAGFGMRFGLLALAMTVAVASGAHPVGLVLGLSTIVPAVIIAAFRWQPPPVPADAVPAPPPDDPSWDDWNPWTARPRLRDDDDEEDA